MGAGSRYLLSLKNNELTFRAPLGVFVLKNTPTKIFLATGTGITPFKSMVMSLVKMNLALHFLSTGDFDQKTIYI